MFNEMSEARTRLGQRKKRQQSTGDPALGQMAASHWFHRACSTVRLVCLKPMSGKPLISDPFNTRHQDELLIFISSLAVEKKTKKMKSAPNRTLLGHDFSTLKNICARNRAHVLFVFYRFFFRVWCPKRMPEKKKTGKHACLHASLPAAGSSAPRSQIHPSTIAPHSAEAPTSLLSLERCLEVSSTKLQDAPLKVLSTPQWAPNLPSLEKYLMESGVQKGREREKEARQKERKKKKKRNARAGN